MSRRKGSKYERRLGDFFHAAEFMVMRSPSSGSGTDRDQPDLLVVDPDIGSYSFEAKYIGDSSGIIYLDPEEIEQLKRFSKGTASVPIVATRWSQDAAFYLWLPEDLDRTAGGMYRVHRDDVEEDRYVGVLADGENHGLDGGGHGVTPHAVRRTGPLLDDEAVEDPSSDDERLVLLSIHEAMADAILSGEKRYEYRRVPPAIDPPYTGLLYVGEDVQGIVGAATIGNETTLPVDVLVERTIDATPQDPRDVREYFSGRDLGTALSIGGYTRFADPILLEDLQNRLPDFAVPQNFRYLDGDECATVGDILDTGVIAAP